MRVAIYGGYFDPPTIAHKQIVTDILNEHIVDKIIVMPCFEHKFGKNGSDSNIRLELTKETFNNISDVIVSDYEIKNKLKLSTYEVLKEFIHKYDIISPCDDLYLIIGLDNANNFDKWCYAEELKRMVSFIIAPRVGEWINFDFWYCKPPHILLNKEFPCISSTIIRNTFYKNENIQNMTPVCETIKKLGLYK